MAQSERSDEGDLWDVTAPLKKTRREKRKFVSTTSNCLDEQKLDLEGRICSAKIVSCLSVCVLSE